MTGDTANPVVARSARYWGIGLTLAILVLVADQVHKWWMLSVYSIATKGRVAVTPFLDLVLGKQVLTVVRDPADKGDQFPVVVLVDRELPHDDGI